jgi:threonine aldolase
MLVGPHAFIKKARQFRKLFGGGVRQIGFVSACVAYSLTHHLPLLPSVHALARRLAEGLQKAGCVITAPVDTCIVSYDPGPLGLEYREVAERAAELETPLSIAGSRLVVSPHTSSSKTSVLCF